MKKERSEHMDVFFILIWSFVIFFGFIAFWGFLEHLLGITYEFQMFNC